MMDGMEDLKNPRKKHKRRCEIAQTEDGDNDSDFKPLSGASCHKKRKKSKDKELSPDLTEIGTAVKSKHVKKAKKRSNSSDSTKSVKGQNFDIKSSLSVPCDTSENGHKSKKKRKKSPHGQDDIITASTENVSDSNTARQKSNSIDSTKKVKGHNFDKSSMSVPSDTCTSEKGYKSKKKKRKKSPHSQDHKITASNENASDFITLSKYQVDNGKKSNSERKTEKPNKRKHKDSLAEQTVVDKESEQGLCGETVRSLQEIDKKNLSKYKKDKTIIQVPVLESKATNDEKASNFGAKKKHKYSEKEDVQHLDHSPVDFKGHKKEMTPISKQKCSDKNVQKRKRDETDAAKIIQLKQAGMEKIEETDIKTCNSDSSKGKKKKKKPKQCKDDDNNSYSMQNQVDKSTLRKKSKEDEGTKPLLREQWPDDNNMVYKKEKNKKESTKSIQHVGKSGREDLKSDFLSNSNSRISNQKKNNKKKSSDLQNTQSDITCLSSSSSHITSVSSPVVSIEKEVPKKEKKSRNKDKSPSSCSKREAQNITESPIIKNETEINGNVNENKKNIKIGQWGTAGFENEQRQLKFFRLLGGFKASDTTAPEEKKLPKSSIGPRRSHGNFAMSQSEESAYTTNMSTQYEKAMGFNLQRGVGLGFQPPPNAGKTFYIDKNESKSKKFDDSDE